MYSCLAVFFTDYFGKRKCFQILFNVDLIFCLKLGKASKFRFHSRNTSNIF